MTPPLDHERGPGRDHGMTTAEYAVGTLGACTMGLVLHELATDGFWFDQLMRIFVRALAWRNILDGFPVPNIGRR